MRLQTEVQVRQSHRRNPRHTKIMSRESEQACSDSHRLLSKRELKELELRLTLRLGSMIVAAVCVVAVLTRLL